MTKVITSDFHTVFRAEAGLAIFDFSAPGPASGGIRKSRFVRKLHFVFLGYKKWPFYTLLHHIWCLALPGLEVSSLVVLATFGGGFGPGVGVLAAKMR